jgi:uncharacterized protein YkwD
MTARMGLAIAGALLLAGCAQGPERVVERRDTMAPAPRGPSLLKTAMMDGHNAARAAVGVAPLTWSDTLATTARAYAEELARTGKFAHAPQPQGMSREGENLWTGTRYAYAYPEMIGHWVAENRDEDVAHYTQIVWRGSTQVGCAMASNKTDDYLVCRYSPPGNVFGERAY